MRRHQYIRIAVVLFLFVGLQAAAFGQAADDGKLATVIGGGSIIRWDVAAPNAGGTLTITTPDNRSFRRTFRAGGAAEFSLNDKQAEGLPDGVYTYELRLTPVLTGPQKEALVKARGNDDDPEAERGARKRQVLPTMSQSGSFSIVNGSIVVAGAIENQRNGKGASLRPTRFMSANTVSRLFNHRVALGAMPDVVTADDEIIQGSACIGLDCQNGENFGFDTVRLKENNDRIQFDDTSTSAGFPSNNWQIRANSSGSGGGNFLGFVDQGTTGNSETGTIVFEVDAGANANSLRVGSNSKIGLRTATPVLDVHMNTSDTPAIRFEQNNSGGFTAQTWDVAGNEANFFVRDVTGGSRLPFRIRPGAPTSSIDISATGNVGIGTASPANKLDVVTTLATTALALKADANMISQLIFSHGGTDKWFLSSRGTADTPNNRLSFFFNTGSGFAERLTLDASGNVGVNTNTPDQRFSVNGDASKVGGGSWQTFSDERLKNIRGTFNRSLNAVLQLQPLRYEYKSNNALGLVSDGEHVGFSAQALQQVIPEAVTPNSQGYLMVNNDPIMWTMLNAIKEQQKQIEDLKAQVRKLRATSRRHKR